MNLVRLGCCILAAAVSGSAQQAAEKIEFFERRIRPVLTNNCYTCHTDSKLGGLQVNSRVALLSGGSRGAAINVGNPDDSLLIKAVMHVDPTLKMPLGGAKLKDNEIADLKYWIQTGAVWPDAICNSPPTFRLPETGMSMNGIRKAVTAARARRSMSPTPAARRL